MQYEYKSKAIQRQHKYVSNTTRIQNEYNTNTVLRQYGHTRLQDTIQDECLTHTIRIQLSYDTKPKKTQGVQYTYNTIQDPNNTNLLWLKKEDNTNAKPINYE